MSHKSTWFLFYVFLARIFFNKSQARCSFDYKCQEHTLVYSRRHVLVGISDIMATISGSILWILARSHKPGLLSFYSSIFANFWDLLKTEYTVWKWTATAFTCISQISIFFVFEMIHKASSQNVLCFSGNGTFFQILWRNGINSPDLMINW